MPTICSFRGIKIYINWNDHRPPHVHAKYCGYEVSVLIKDLEVLDGKMPKKQLNMILGWVAFHQDELMENWKLAENKEDLFEIEPMK